jgi:SAM-dependent methyltransferase
MLSEAKSITHEHLLSIINTESHRFGDGSSIRLLDMGCGDGELIVYLAKNLPLLNKSLVFEVYGFDVYDHGVQKRGFITDTVNRLSDEIQDICWQDRIVSISSNENWPYPNGFFDVIISNQVLEHVADHALVFSEICRTLHEGGISVHLFPLKHYLYETHLNLPLVHRIQSYDILFSYIKWMSRKGMGKFKNVRNNISLEKYAKMHADYIFYHTNYISYKDSLLLAKKYRMRISFKYTPEFYLRKIQNVLSLNKHYIYNKDRSAFLDWLSLTVLKYISSVTLFLEKEELYTKQ